MSTADEIVIRSLHDTNELEKVRELESLIWGAADSIPTHQTITAVKNGGLVLGAFAGDRLVGFQYSFAGFNGRDVYLCSHVLGTAPEFRNKGIGEKLKRAQRNEALKLGYSLITWTYDPLEGANGYLNIAKLGGMCSTYIENCYGEMDDSLNRGLPSDRFLVEWHITKEHCIDFSKITEEEAAQNSVIKWEVTDNGIVVPTEVTFPDNTVQTAFVAIPTNYRQIRTTDHKSAMDWRMKTRNAFVRLFADGWMVTGFKRAELPVQFYVLTRKSDYLNEN